MTTNFWLPGDPLTIGMLGPSDAGKTTFLLAAHSSGVDRTARLRLRADDPAQRAQLDAGWRLLSEQGTFPPGTDRPHEYALRLDVGPGGQIPVRLQDHRGGVLTDSAASAQSDHLISHLVRSDVVILVIDGATLGGWIAETERPNVTAPATAGVARSLHLGRTLGLLMSAVTARRQEGRPTPSLVLLVTKADAIARTAAPGVVADLPHHLRAILPIAFTERTLTMVSAVQVGSVADGHITPRGFMAPFAFAALVRLGSERRAVKARLAAATRMRERPSARAGTSRFVLPLLTGTDPAELLVPDVEFLLALQRRLVVVRRQIDELIAELAGSMILRGAERIRPEDLAGVSWP